MPERKRYQREYFHSEPDGIEIRIGFDTDLGRVIAFTVQLECWIDGEWRPAMRYDTAHDQAHRDTLDWTGRVVDKLWLAAEKDYNSALSEAIRDLSEHARSYRDQFLGRRPR
jgi:hypothetical protein